jgi:HAD superfamily hydrolase (TIGR01490 family)
MQLVQPERMVKRMLSWFAGIEEKKLIEMTEEIFHTFLKPAIREQIVEEIRRHQQNGGQTVILSAAVTYICRPIQDFLQMDEMICTHLEVIDGKLSGKSKGAYCFGQEKLKQAERYCDANGYRLENAYFYADSMADYPVLTEIGHPVCVDPEQRLRRIAEQRDWRIMD